jgi:hypothetical protein
VNATLTHAGARQVDGRLLTRRRRPEEALLHGTEREWFLSPPAAPGDWTISGGCCAFGGTAASAQQALLRARTWRQEVSFDAEDRQLITPRLRVVLGTGATHLNDLFEGSDGFAGNRHVRVQHPAVDHAVRIGDSGLVKDRNLQSL